LFSDTSASLPSDIKTKASINDPIQQPVKLGDNDPSLGLVTTWLLREHHLPLLPSKSE
jgi:hypothetical protein